MRRFLPLAALILACLAQLATAQTRARPVERLLIVTMDGMRWQEVFGGAERRLISATAGGVPDTLALAARFWETGADGRRLRLMPFLWGTVARSGWILGDSAAGSEVRVTNGKRFSYPGYNELLTGAPDDRVDSNDKIPNPNVSVLEWLDHMKGFKGKVAAFGDWDVLPSILNAGRSHLPINGEGPPFPSPRNEAERELNAMAADLPPYWAGARFDAVPMAGSLRYLRTRKPRVLYVLLGDTDEWAHERRYDLYLDAAWRADRFLRRLWEAAQAMPEYRGKTALLIATDHGRGDSNDWTDHGRKTPAAERIWMAGLGTGKPAARGLLTQSQFAATIAAVLGLGEAFGKARPGAAPPVKLLP
jgi:hypothetical protein